MLTSSVFAKIQQHFSIIRSKELINLFQEEGKNRASEFTYELDEMLLDISKNLITKETISLFVELAEEFNLNNKMKHMFDGDKVNFTENRSVSHMALRDDDLKKLVIDNHDYSGDINSTKEKMFSFAKKFRNGEVIGATGKPLDTIVNVGIGGSYLGSAMACNALKEFDDKNIKTYFISNVDYSNLLEVFSQIDVEKTLFIIASKTFTTSETMQNAKTLKELFIHQINPDNLLGAITKHFAGVSSNPEKAKEFGISEEYIFNFWDFVGGRFSIWSACGLSLLLKIGEDHFKSFLLGANLVDKHALNTNLHENLPFLMAAIGIWNNNVQNNKSYAIIPYDHRLSSFPKYIQQLEMESNGKSTDSEGHRIFYNTSPVIFGEPGTDSQHSFFQLLHQGTQTIPCDFIGFINNNIDKTNSDTHQDLLFSNMLAQSEALMVGKPKSSVMQENSDDKPLHEYSDFANHKVIDGNKPTNMIVFNSLSPKTLGMLCALYEHKTVMQGILWNINSFDQYGVELGKNLSQSIIDELHMVDANNEESNNDSKFSSSTYNLIKLYKSKKQSNDKSN